jgi:hypothetical protein
MLSRAGALAGVCGSSKAPCAEKRAGPERAESKQRISTSLWRRPGGVVIVDSPGRHLDAAAFDGGLGSIAHNMVERDDPPGPGRLFHQPLALGVVDRGDDRLVVEISCHGLVAQQDKPLTVERQPVVDRARVVDVRCGPARPAAGRNCRNRASPPSAP